MGVYKANEPACRNGDLHLVVEEYYQLHPERRDQQRVLFFLDEIQVVPGWEKFARRLLDTEQVELFLSGSSAQLLSREKEGPRAVAGYRSPGVSPVLLAMRASILGPISSWSWKANT